MYLNELLDLYIHDDSIEDFEIKLNVKNEIFNCEIIEVNREDNSIVLKQEVDEEAEVIKQCCANCNLLKGNVCEYFNHEVELDNVCNEWEFI